MREDYIMIGHLAHGSTTLEPFFVGHHHHIRHFFFELDSAWLPFFCFKDFSGGTWHLFGRFKRREERRGYLLPLKNLPLSDWIWLCGE